MSETRSWNGWQVSGVALAAVGGAMVTLLILLLFYQLDGLNGVASPLRVSGGQWQIAAGQGGPTATGLEIRQSDPRGWAAAQGSARMVRANLYRRLSWQVDGLAPGRELRLIWTTQAEPRTVRERVLPPAGPNGGALDLSEEPNWQGRIALIGLMTHGPLPQPLVIRRLELQPARLSSTELLRRAVEDWTSFEDWSQRSINYTSGAPRDALFPPVLIVALWVGFSAACYALFAPPRWRAERRWPYAALFLLGWLALDGRWQWDLNQRLDQTRTHFAGKTEVERRLADLDGDFYRFLGEVRQRLPESPVRLLILSSDPGGFWAGRARYHLLPHNGYAGLVQLPRPNQAHPGDYVLMLAPLPGVAYRAEQRILESGKQRLPVEPLYTVAAGMLFRVREGE
ncbi:MAG: hypothetical protein LM550_04585 [Candidatus Contendobacter sp.]|jgi:hypothetical protein|nr:hypothetical protein [Candidatus Contendobacter sp.]